MSGETVKIRCNMSLHYATNTDYEEVIDTGIPRSEWAEMSEEERQKVSEEIYEEFVWAHLDGGWDVVDGGEDQ